MSPFTQQRSRSVASLGEQNLLRTIQGWLGDTCPATPHGMGDDCAVMQGSSRPQLVTVDPVIYGEHFDDHTPAAGVGRKLFNRNISDIAAMGGRPRAAVIALNICNTTKVGWLRRFYEGIAVQARRYHVPIIGGDLARLSNGFAASMTMIGEASHQRVLPRRGSQQGDWIMVTGSLGGSRRGHHWKFEPRLEQGQWLVRRSGVVSMMDISDGLAKDLLALTPPGCRAALQTEQVPVSASATRAAKSSGQTPLQHALTDGEDYELLFTIKTGANVRSLLSAWKRHFDLPLTCVGQFVSAAQPLAPDEVDLRDYHGFEHLR